MLISQTTPDEHPPTPQPNRWPALTTLPNVASFQLVWRRVCDVVMFRSSYLFERTLTAVYALPRVSVLSEYNVYSNILWPSKCSLYFRPDRLVSFWSQDGALRREYPPRRLSSPLFLSADATATPMTSSHHFTPPRQVSARVWLRLCEALLSSLAGQKHPSLSRLFELSRYKGHEHEYQIVRYICGRSECAHSDVCSLNTAVVEGPIECHKSWLASCETADGLTGTHSKGSLDQTESVPKWSRERLARVGLREVSRQGKDVSSLNLHHSLCPEL